MHVSHDQLFVKSIPEGDSELTSPINKNQDTFSCFLKNETILKPVSISSAANRIYLVLDKKKTEIVVPP